DDFLQRPDDGGWSSDHEAQGPEGRVDAHEVAFPEPEVPKPGDQLPLPDPVQQEIRPEQRLANEAAPKPVAPPQGLQALPHGHADLPLTRRRLASSESCA